MAEERQPVVADPWTNRRIIFLAVVVALIFYAVFNLPPTLNYLLARARDTLILLILAVALAYFLLPVVDALCRIPVRMQPRAQRSLAATLTIVLFLGLVVLLTTVIIAPIVEEVGQVLQTVTRWAQEDLTGQIEGFVDGLLSRLPDEYRIQIEQQIAAAEREWTVERITAEVSARFQAWGRSILQWQMNLIATILSSSGYVIALLIVPVFSYYFLTDATSIRNGIGSYIPPGTRRQYHEMLDDMDLVIRRYVHTVMLVSLMTGLATAATLYFAGVDVFLTFGILAGIANMVPVLGGVAATVAIVAISLLQVGVKTTVIVMIVYGAIQLITDRVISPKLMAEGAQLHPVAVLVGLLVGAEFFGLIGVFIAVPALAAARVAWLHYRDFVSSGEQSREIDSLLRREPEAGLPAGAGEPAEDLPERSEIPCGAPEDAAEVVAEDEATEAAVNGVEDADERT